MDFNEDMRNRFTYHVPKDEATIALHTTVRQQCWKVALMLEDIPDSREKSLAITKLEEAMMWANAAIARHQS